MICVIDYKSVVPVTLTVQINLVIVTYNLPVILTNVPRWSHFLPKRDWPSQKRFVLLKVAGEKKIKLKWKFCSNITKSHTMVTILWHTIQNGHLAENWLKLALISITCHRLCVTNETNVTAFAGSKMTRWRPGRIHKLATRFTRGD